MSDENTKLLQEIAKWSKVLAFDIIRNKVDALSAEDKIIYDLSTQENTLRDIAQKVKPQISAISAKQKAWYSQGIMEIVSVQRGSRYVKLASLKELGIGAIGAENE